MALKREFYRALEDVLGPENVSEDPVIVYSYTVPMAGMGKPPKEGDLDIIDWAKAEEEEEDSPLFEAITLPKDTAEVQAIVKLCNRYKVQYKASSTGNQYSDPDGPGCIKIDLRRMNRIIEINEKGMYAVVEPCVIGAQLQAECMKRGFNCNLMGGGSNFSALPIAAHAGLGHLSMSGSYGERNQLALEWVTGDGEVVKFGSLGSLGEWFCGDGPGPSLRGVIRGNTTPLGGLGVFTKAAQKIYHWPGPTVMTVEGVSPDYIPQVPPNFLMRYYSFPSMEILVEAVSKIGEIEIAYELMAFQADMVAANLPNANKAEENKVLGQIKEAMLGPGFMVILAGNSAGDFEYKKRVLERIIDETGGESLKLVEDPQNVGGFLWRWTRITGSLRETGRCMSRGGSGFTGGTGLYPLQTRYVQRVSEIRQAFIKKKLIDDSDPYAGTFFFVQPIENGHTGHGEAGVTYSKLTPKEQFGNMDRAFRRHVHKTAIDGHFGVPHAAWGDVIHNMYGPHTSNYPKWMRKIKETFDPNNASEASTYITSEE